MPPYWSLNRAGGGSDCPLPGARPLPGVARAGRLSLVTLAYWATGVSSTGTHTPTRPTRPASRGHCLASYEVARCGLSCLQVTHTLRPRGACHVAIRPLDQAMPPVERQPVAVWAALVVLLSV